ncbi:F0F1 ATP synthase subunit B [Pseudofulvibacter geojedonensis]|uniref:ATP synthase subunit b n=1 Tax=Pseudofulvibacter geojedonensis TaxID=1123758 RepID=A0ABW3I3Y1_9FLAO
MDQLLNDFSPGLFFMQAIILLILIVLMRKFAWKPILDSLQSREEGIQGALDAAENAKKEMANLQADNEKLLKEARAEREAMLKDAREMKDKIVADAKAEAQAQADKTIAQAQATIAAEKASAMAELKNTVASLSVEIAEKVVREELSNKDKQLGLVEKSLAEVTLN